MNTGDVNALIMGESQAVGERWIIDDDGDIRAVNFGGRGDIVCQQPQEGFHESRAHWPRRRRLIVAAPKLVEALKECEELLDAILYGKTRLVGPTLTNVRDALSLLPDAAELSKGGV